MAHCICILKVRAAREKKTYFIYDYGKREKDAAGDVGSVAQQLFYGEHGFDVSKVIYVMSRLGTKVASQGLCSA